MEDNPKKNVKESRILKDFFEEKDLIINILLSSLCILFILYPINNNIFNHAINSILFYVLPGYTLTSFLFPRKNSISIFRRITLLFMSSILIFTSLGLIITYSGLQITNSTLSIIDYFFILILSFIIFIIRINIPPEEKFTIKSDLISRINNIFKDKSNKEKISFLVFSSLMIISLLILVYITFSPNLEDTFTEFYLLGPDGEISNIPTNFKLDEEKNIIVRIINHENKAINYRLVITHENKVLQENNVYLLNENKSEINFSFKPTKKGIKQALVFILYRDSTIKIDELKLNIDVK